VRDDRSSYVDAAAWAVLAAGALPWCRPCRTSCPGHPALLAAERQMIVLMPGEDDTATKATTS